MAHYSPEEAFETLKTRVADSIKDHFPIEGKKNVLKANKVWIDDSLHIDDIRGQKDAKLKGRTWSVPIRAELELRDKNTNKILDRKAVTVGQLPKVTRRYSYIVNGNEYQVNNQFRLKSGVYTRVTGRGDIASQWNLAKGLGFEMNFDPKTKKMSMKYPKGSNVPLYPILKAVGVADDDIERHWGKEVLSANKDDKEDAALRKFYKTFNGENPEDIAAARKFVEKELGNTKLRPDSTKVTLGKAFDTVSGSALLAGSEKILKVSRKEAEPDDRDSLEFKDLWSAEDLLEERIRKKSAWDIKRKYGNTVDKYTKVKSIANPDIISKPIKGFFTNSTLAERPDQMNPVSFISGNRRTTIMGEGGVTSSHQVTLDAKSINPSHMGFVDPIQTPECYDEKTQVFTSDGWKYWKDVTAADLLACNLEGELHFRHPEELHKSHYQGPMYGLRSGKIDYLVTPDHRMYVATPWRRDKWSIVDAPRVHGKERVFDCAHAPYAPVEVQNFFTLPTVAGGNATKTYGPIDMVAWAEFMGWYLSEGSSKYNEDTSDYLVQLSQSLDQNPDEYYMIKTLVEKMPGSWCQNAQRDAFTAGSKQLAKYLQQFGKSQDKFIPECLFQASVEARETLLEALILGDGRNGSHRKDGHSYSQRVYTTTSPQLAADVERLSIGLGFPVSVSRYPDEREDRYLDVFEVRLLRHRYRTARPKHPKYPAKYYVVEDYDGMVYCATVPGGLLYVKREGRTGFWCGNSHKIGTTLQLAFGVKKDGKDLKVRAYNTKNGKTEWISAATARHSNVAFPDQYTWDGTKPKPISTTVKSADKDGTISSMSPKEVDYVLKSSKGMFDMSANMIPFLQNDQGNRTMVAAKQLEQAISLRDREAPLVQTKGEGKKTFEQVVGSFTAHRTDVDGTVERVGKDHMVIRSNDGKRHEVQIYDDFPLNDPKSMLNSTPVVKKGDSVKKGQVVADTNFTRDGILALGRNLRVAYMPYKGYNFEDGIVISDSAAKKLTSTHMYRDSIVSEKNVILNKKKFLAETIGTTTKSQADKLDDDGVIQEGQSVVPGDVLIAMMKREEVSPEAQKLGLFSKKLLRPVKARPVIWDKDVPGVVNKVVRHGKSTTVFVKAEASADIGDKIVGRHGNKGIITCFSNDSEVLAESGWKLFRDLELGERVCTLNPDTNQIQYQEPTRYINEPYEGKMYQYEGRRLNLLVTPTHRHYVRSRRGEFGFETAEESAGLPRIHKRTGCWDVEDLEEVIIPARPHKPNFKKKFSETKTYPADDFLEFFGYWVTEGCLGGSSHIHIGQSKEKNSDTYFAIKSCLERLGYNVCDQPDTLIISDPRLHLWLQQFGKATEKFIPREFLAASSRQLRILADALFAGDGGVYYREKDNHTRYELFTSSKRLADDYQELSLKLGLSANIKPQDRDGRKNVEYVVRWSFKEEVWTNNDKRYDNEKWVDYDGRVYCVEVPNHIVYVRRGGIPVWSGNSILPDHEMPHNKDGTPVEVLLNPTGVPCYDTETEFLTTEGWVKAPYITQNHVFATVNPETLMLEFQEPEEVYHIPHQGKMYRLENQQLDMLVTPNHKQFTARRGNSKLSGMLNLDDPELPSLFELKEAREIAGEPRRYLKAAKWNGVSDLVYYIGQGTQSITGPKLKKGINVTAPVWAEFMGWFLSEGSTYFNKANYSYVTEISQSLEVNPENYQRIVDLLEAFGQPLELTNWGIRIKHKGLYERLHPLGRARDKYIPQEVLAMSPEHLHMFLDALVSGDGSEVWNDETGHYGNKRYWTASKRLADGVQEVAAKLGISANIKRESRRGEDACYYIGLSGSRFAPWVNWSSTTKANQVEGWVEYNGMVHCATVPNGTLLVRRNGKAVFSGNTRINVGQVLETAASKIAKKTGKPYVVNNFDPRNKDYTRDLRKELKSHGLSDTESLTDPTTGQKYENVLTGHQYILKLHHTAEKGLQSRSRDSYNSNLTPSKGGPKGGQTMDIMGMYAMLAHNARENVREMQTFKCFLRRTMVETDQGPMMISNIVNKKLPVKVLSWNDDQRKFEYQAIMNYTKREIDTPLVRVEFMARNSRGEYKRAVSKCTEGHKFFTTVGKVEAKDLEGKTLLTPGLKPDSYQFDVLVGSLLGDGHLSKRHHHFPSFQERHSIKQREYLEFKAAVLADFSTRDVRDYCAGEEGFNVGQDMCEWGTLAQPSFLGNKGLGLYGMFYEDKVKKVPKDCANLLSPLAVAVWYQDDGSLTRGNRQRVVRLHTGSFTEEDRHELIEGLAQKIGVRFTELKNNSSMDLRLGKSEDIDKFFNYIRSFVHPSLAYKIDGPVGEGLDRVLDEARARDGLVEVPVLQVNDYNDVSFNDGKYLYNIEVEGNHNYFANRVLVGNSDMNDDFWTALQAGDPIPPPKVPFAHKKFEGYLKGMGVDVRKDGNSLILSPLTDKKVLEMSNGELKDPARAVRGKDARPEVGGIFDPEITGTSWPLGKLGDKWSHITLAERMPNPLFEKPVTALLGMKSSEFNEVVNGDRDLGGNTGPSAIAYALKKVNVDKEEKELNETVKKLRGSNLNKANKKLKYLRALRRAGLTPTEAYTTKHLPIMPPVMRPLTVLDNGDLRMDDVNNIYRHIGAANDQLKNFDVRLPEEEKKDLRSELYDGLKGLALTGITSQGRHFSGIGETLAGKTQPKEGFFQSRVIGRRQDLSMRSTIVPEPSLSLDEVGIPRKAAAELYKPFVVRRLRRQGYTPLDAIQEVKKDTISARQALETEVDIRPLLLKRDPVLHKHGVQAFKVRLTTGKAIKIHPLATAGYNADFDGDKMSAFVPVSEAAVREAMKMMPSRNLFSPSTGQLMFKPTQESMMGLFKLTEMGEDTGKSIATIAEAAKKVREGDLQINDVIHISNVNDDLFTKLSAAPIKTTVGRIMVYQSLPEKMRDKRILTDPDFVLDKKTLHNVLTDVGKNYQGDFARVADRMKDLGNTFSTGLSFGLEDFESDKRFRDSLMASARKKESQIRSSKKGQAKTDAIVDLYVATGKAIDKKTKARANASSNRMYDWVRSGARGSWDQFKQMTVAPMLVADSKGNPVPIPIDRSYSEGLDIGSYWAAMHGARMGTIGRVLGTETPGMLSKQMVNATMDQVVTGKDCGTGRGIPLKVEDRDTLDRYTAKNINLGVRGGKDKGSIPAGTLVTPEILSRLKNNKVDEVEVRSPLKCSHGKGLCATCYGLNEKGKLPENGENLGIMAAHALGEPATQLAMNSFHTGGVVGAKGTTATNKFARLQQLLQIPKILPGSAILAETDGKVEKVEKDPVGGWNVFVKSRSHYVPGRRDLHVKKGDTVKKGDSLSSGDKNPRQVLSLVGMPAVQSYLTKELYKAYEGVAPIRRRNVETFVRSITNTAKITDAGDHDMFLPGDMAPLSELEAFNKEIPKDKKKILYEHKLTGVAMVPKEVMTDWIARMNSRNLKQTLIDASSEGWRSNLHSTHPIPGMSYGAEFGKGTLEEPWLY